MTRTLQKIGNSRGLVLTKTMLDHLGVTDTVDVRLVDGQIVLSAPEGREAMPAADAAAVGRTEELTARFVQRLERGVDFGDTPIPTREDLYADRLRER